MFPPAPDIAAQKATLRREMKARRAMLDEAARARASWLACEIMANWLEAQPGRSVAVFLSRPSEICLDVLARELLRENYIVAAPRLDLEQGAMKFYRLPNLEAVESGPWGVREPVAGEEIRPEIVLVPGLAFDECGHRLGTGGGWYDRVLDATQIKIGVGFAAQIVPAVPVEAHDKTLDWVASDEGLIRCG